ncbi:hypothetical protein KC363_g2086 [Hortaea werneckii]|uniref:FAD-binding FR-type domain-containing protein n=1 Tax=Hortaea werneckii TaxID=91943 RepID=A0A3M7FYI4_HORWE|nr:hypothetical protein KC361_g873 [Hortaea werneckii]KAI6888876.1 hypothetical protein KC325_g977 [Hortaea werneckii]KAI7000279.1 hypothetical protein KC359_g1266 [Hortaea werneckii]KAI7149967.1 hypothetical protein KC344_g535 [Hortaea werneckii]KAI7179716.1 hypothetical protein KC360_g642 [Hortaea werneckii]
MDGPIETAQENYTPLTDEEVNAFFADLDRDGDGYVSLSELEEKLHQVHEELAPKPLKHHLHHPSRRGAGDVEKNARPKEEDGLHAFLCSLMPGSSDAEGARMNRADFVARVKKWQVPSQKQTDSKTQDHDDAEAEHRLPWRRRLRAYWAVHGPTILFMAVVLALQLALGLWQLISYLRKPLVRAALGWGVVLAKTSAGVLYPTLFFMLLSMSRHLATFIRGRSYYLSRFINWDLSQAFHIYMSLAGLFFASLHAIGHLTGSFLYGSRPAQQDDVARILGPEAVPRPYARYARSLPGWTGIASLGMFWVISLLSLPIVRKWRYEVFQLGHLLMFPMIALLCAHGTEALLQVPMLGYWLVFPALLVILERSWRLVRGFLSVPARAKVLDDDTMLITCKHPEGRDWRYSAGQYILLQVPKVSFFQWHPFTISSCRGDILQVHIKFDGDWTNSLREKLPEDCEFRVGLDGPFGAPAQRFYDYDYSIIVGGGIGITPFSAILTDLEESYTERKDPWEERRRSRSLSRPGSRSQSRPSSRTSPASDEQLQTDDKADMRSSRSQQPERRVDLHWTVRERNNLLWFSDLLNRAIDGAGPLARHGNLDLNINTHITAKRKNISTHIFRYLLDSYRTPTAPYSALTGLKQPSHFGRPDFDAILDQHYNDLVSAGIKEKKVGVFYCGTPVVGKILSDKCHELTARARDRGLKIRYDFLMEVFG